MRYQHPLASLFFVALSLFGIPSFDKLHLASRPMKVLWTHLRLGNLLKVVLRLFSSIVATPSQRMHAIRVHQFGDPSVLQYENTTVPPVTKSHVRVKILSSGVNPVETYIRTGAHAIKPELPYTPGNDGAGVVDEIGEDVTGVCVGDRVYLTGSVSGTYAQYSLSHDVHALPENISFDQGAAINIPYRTAYLSYKRSHARPGQTVFIHGGSGGVGVAAIQFGRSLGLKVIASAGTPEGLSLVKSLGAHHAVNHRQDGYLANVTALTGGRGPDIILEMLANVNLQKDLEIIASYGTIAVIGSRGPVEIMPRSIMGRSAAIVGIMAASFASNEERIETFAAISSAHATLGLQLGTLSPIVGQKFPLAQAVDAHREVIEHKAGSAGKIVLAPWTV